MARDQPSSPLPVSWPRTLRQVRGWLDPWTFLWRCWRSWSNAPPPPELRALLDAVGQGHPLDLSPSEWRVYEEYNEMNAQRLTEGWDVIIVHDPQPVAVRQHVPEKSRTCAVNVVVDPSSKVSVTGVSVPVRNGPVSPMNMM